MSGSFVISLDFELMWGVRDHRSIADYGDAVLGGREAIASARSATKSNADAAAPAASGNPIGDGEPGI